MKYGWILFFSLMISGYTSFSQDNVFEEEELDFVLERAQPLTIDLEEEEEERKEKTKKKKVKKNRYYGYKTKKGFVRTGYGDNLTVEIFNYLKDWVEPDPYAREVYWYDFRRKQIRVNGNIDTKYGRILHGPYKKIRGEQLRTEGVYYIGTKHGRWIDLDNNDILVNKEKYFKGWPKESLVRYYDEKRTILKEVIPVVYGEIEGEYFYFHENGSVAVQGTYENSTKTGLWTEYFEFRRRRKRQIQYPQNPYDKEFKPYISKEWNNEGVEVYDRIKFMKRN